MKYWLRLPLSGGSAWKAVTRAWIAMSSYVIMPASAMTRRMKIKLIDFGVPEDRRPFRPHGNDVGADVYIPYDCTLQPGRIAKVPLGLGIEVPGGYAGYVFPRASMAEKGLVCELPPVDSGYREEIHAIISNISSQTQELSKGSRVGQLVIPRLSADFVSELGKQRGTDGF